MASDNPAETAAKGAAKGAGKAAAFLRAKTFGMPRWAFLALLAGGVGVGLYLRSRTPADTTAADATDAGTDTVDPYADPYGLDTGNPDLAGVGALAGPSAGSMVPVDSPTIPQGYTDLAAVLGDVLSNITYQDPNAFDPEAPAGGHGGGATGGGPPGRHGNHHGHGEHNGRHGGGGGGGGGHGGGGGGHGGGGGGHGGGGGGHGGGGGGHGGGGGGHGNATAATSRKRGRRRH